MQLTDAYLSQGRESGRRLRKGTAASRSPSYRGVSPAGRRRTSTHGGTPFPVSRKTWCCTCPDPSDPLCRDDRRFRSSLHIQIDVAHVMLVTTLELVRSPSCQKTNSRCACCCMSMRDADIHSPVDVGIWIGAMLKLFTTLLPIR